MHFNLKNRLKDKYPKMFKRPYSLPNCGGGWYPLINSLCKAIENHCKSNQWKKDPEDIEFPEVHQCKSKFGGLRFYTDVTDPEIRGMIFMAENQSTKICERCSLRGRMRNINGWYIVFCKRCLNKELNERNIRIRGGR